MSARKCEWSMSFIRCSCVLDIHTAYRPNTSERAPVCRDVNKATEYKAKAKANVLLLLLHTSHHTTILNPIYICKLF